MSGTNVAPVIIKRKKVVAGEGHHGGAWKVAYADFVTAMMAFFMLMWLLNATTEKQRKGIADYFNPTIPVNRISGGGEGSFGGTSVFSEETLAQAGMGATNKHATEQNQARGQSGLMENGRADDADAQQAVLEAVITALLARGGESIELLWNGGETGELSIPGKATVQILGSKRLTVVDRLLKAYKRGVPAVKTSALNYDLNGIAIRNVFGAKLWARLEGVYIRSAGHGLWEIAF